MPPKKTKFVSINSSTAEAPILPGRQRCECQVVKHELVNNCLSCGRVVCQQEGAGPCMYCGELVMTKSERARLMTGNPKETKKLMDKYDRLDAQQKVAETKQKEAQAVKDRLLEYDRTSVRRTKVIDDQSDYFAAENPWLSEEEKAYIQKKQEAYRDAKSRLKKKTKVTIDFAGRRIIEEVPELPIIEDMAFLNIGRKNKMDDRMLTDTSEGVEMIQPEFVGKLEKHCNATPVLWSNRIQDPELQEMVDAGNCLSISQPYATLIMDGIKQFEGRSWYTPVRGRLWICAGGKQPTPELIEQVELSYKHIAGDVTFPSHYPTGALLGCVDLLDCIPQEEYLQLYPNGEVSDPYVLVVANPRLLKNPLPIPGKQKIFQLDMLIHQAAKKGLMN